MKTCFTFGISIPRFLERHTHISRELSEKIKDRFEIIGIDGRYASTAFQNGEQYGPSSFTSGQVGCALSHLTAYKRMAELSLPYAFIVEDDVILPTGMEEIISCSLPHLTSRSVISFYSPRPKLTKYSSRGAPKLYSGSLISPLEKLDIQTASAYLIGIDAARSIAHHNEPVIYLADHWFAFFEAGAVDKVLLHYPMPVRVAHFDSSIGYKSALPPNLKAKLSYFSAIRKATIWKRRFTEWRSTHNILLVDEPSFYEQHPRNG